MPEFENINSPPTGSTLEKEIQFSVAQAVQALLSANGWRLYSGPRQEQLNVELAGLLGARHVGLACSGSAALEIVLRACRLTDGDEVLLSAYDYPGNFTAIENCGARPALVDVAKDSWNLSLESLDATWTPTCKVLVVSHLHGLLQPMQALQVWCQSKNVLLIQDACQAIGASVEGRALGAWADATIVSFGGSKVLSAGRGGAWCSNLDSLAQHARVQAGVGSGAYELSELQAAIVLAQLPFLASITQRCREFFHRHTKKLTQYIDGVIVPWSEQLDSTAFYQAGYLLPDSLLEKLEKRIDEGHARELLAGTGKGFDGFHRRSARRCRKESSLVNATEISRRTITLHHRLALQTSSAGYPN